MSIHMTPLSQCVTPTSPDDSSSWHKAPKKKTRSGKPYARPLSTRSPWTDEQIQILVEGVKNHPGKWAVISKLLGRAHTNEECRQKAMNLAELGVRKGKWSSEETALLTKGFQEHPNEWSLIRRDYFHGTRSFHDIKRHAEKLGLAISATEKPRVKFTAPEVNNETYEVLETGAVPAILPQNVPETSDVPVPRAATPSSDFSLFNQVPYESLPSSPLFFENRELLEGFSLSELHFPTLHIPTEPNLLA